MWRVGSSVGRTIYHQVSDDASKNDHLIGVMDTRELAELVVAAVNAAAAARWYPLHRHDDGLHLHHVDHGGHGSHTGVPLVSEAAARYSTTLT